MGRRFKRWVEWWAAQPVVVSELTPGMRVLLRNGSVHRVVHVEPAVMQRGKTTVHLVGQFGQRTTLTRPTFSVLRLAS